MYSQNFVQIRQLFHFDPHLTPISPIFGVNMIPKPKFKFPNLFVPPGATYSQNFVQIAQLFHFDPHLTPISPILWVKTPRIQNLSSNSITKYHWAHLYQFKRSKTIFSIFSIFGLTDLRWWKIFRTLFSKILKKNPKTVITRT